MTLSSTLLAAALVVAPADRLSMADRLFNRSEYAAARSEYAALAGAKGLAPDEILYRLAECDRALGRQKEARQGYARLLTEFPASKHADRARLQKALTGNDTEKRTELKILDSDRVETSVRAAALYHYGDLVGDEDAFARCVKLDPKGRYAPYAILRRASLLAKSADATRRREALTLYLELAFGTDRTFSEEALYLAAAMSFAEKKYRESSSLLHRYLKSYPNGHHAADAVVCCVWSDYLAGRYADALALCGEGKTDDTAYVRAAATQATGDAVRAHQLYAKYLEDYPQGLYRKNAEIPLARLEFETAEKAGDSRKAVESARRSAALSGSAADGLRLAWAFERSGQLEESVREYLSVASMFPGTPEAADAMFRKAMVDLRAEKWSAAELALKEALAGKLDARRRPEAHYWRGVAACRLGHENEGVRELREALKGNLSLDEAREARLMLADIDFNQGRRSEAIAAYGALVREGATDRMSAAKTLAVGKLLPPAEAIICAKALEKSASAEWRQAGFALEGDAEEAEGHLTAAAEAYGKCMAEPCTTEAAARAALKYGVYLCDQGDSRAAEAMLKKAVELNVADNEARAAAYLALARTALGRQDTEAARGYATIVVTLFEKTRAFPDAQRVLSDLEAKK